MHRLLASVLFFACLFLTSSAFAQPLEDDVVSIDEAEIQAYTDSLLAPLDWHTGTIDLGDGLATLAVPEGFRYLDSEDAAYVLEELWGNPPAESMGMLFPADFGPLDDAGWGIDITYLADGYVDDSDAADIDYEELLSDMQKSTTDENTHREEMGYGTIELVGWAAPPYYDAESKKLHWAKELEFDGYAEEHTLNYNIRVLGRRGVLMLNAIGTMSQADVIDEAVPPVLASIDFNEGHRYGDFNPDIDQVAAYGVAGLVAGKVLAKAGLFALLAKSWKLIAVAVVAGFSVLRRFVWGRKDEDAAETA